MRLPGDNELWADRLLEARRRIIEFDVNDRASGMRIPYESGIDEHLATALTALTCGDESALADGIAMIQFLWIAIGIAKRNPKDCQFKVFNQSMAVCMDELSQQMAKRGEK